MQDCGNCAWFTKLGADFGGGLCEKLDARTTTDSGRKCKEHKARKFERVRFLLKPEMLE